MEVEKIDHIHFKTNDIERDTNIIEGMIGRKLPIEADLTTLYGMRIAFHPSPLGFELMEVTDKDQEIGRIYSKAPWGLFAISLKVPNIDKATAPLGADTLEKMAQLLEQKRCHDPITVVC